MAFDITLDREENQINQEREEEQERDMEREGWTREVER